MTYILLKCCALQIRHVKHTYQLSNVLCSQYANRFTEHNYIVLHMKIVSQQNVTDVLSICFCVKMQNANSDPNIIEETITKVLQKHF